MRVLRCMVISFLLVVALATLAYGSESDVTIDAGPDIEIIDIVVEEVYDETYGTLESVTFTWKEAEPVVDTAAIVLYSASAVCLASLLIARRKLH